MNKRSAAESRQRILAAALPVFTDRGYKGASMRAIASGAGISIGGLYLYFENKETIYMTVLKEIFDELTTKVKEAVGQVDDPVQALTSLITLRLAYARKHRELIILQSREQGFAYALTLKRQFFRNQTAIIENILSAGVTGGVFAPCNVKEVAKIIMGTLRGFVLSLVIDPASLFSADECARFLLRGLLGRNG